MISYDNDNLPQKEDKPSEPDAAAVSTDVAGEAAPINQIDSDCVQTTSSSCTTTSAGATAPTINNTLFNLQFQQKTKYIRELWSQQRARINKEYSQFILIIFICAVAIIACVVSLVSNNWTCDVNRNHYFGLWNTCYLPDGLINPIPELTNVTSNDTTIVQNVTNIASRIMCAKQDLFDVKIEYAEQARIDQISASQGLIISGIILYIISIVSFILSYKFLKMNNMNYLRNALISSLFLQIISFLLLLIGFFLFIFTDRLSISITLLFVYFAIAIFATNIINFITIEYKSFKIRKVTI